MNRRRHEGPTATAAVSEDHANALFLHIRHEGLLTSFFFCSSSDGMAKSSAPSSAPAISGSDDTTRPAVDEMAAFRKSRRPASREEEVRDVVNAVVVNASACSTAAPTIRTKANVLDEESIVVYQCVDEYKYEYSSDAVHDIGLLMMSRKLTVASYHDDQIVVHSVAITCNHHTILDPAQYQGICTNPSYQVFRLRKVLY